MKIKKHNWDLTGSSIFILLIGIISVIIGFFVLEDSYYPTPRPFTVWSTLMGVALIICSWGIRKRKIFFIRLTAFVCFLIVIENAMKGLLSYYLKGNFNHPLEILCGLIFFSIISGYFFRIGLLGIDVDNDGVIDNESEERSFKAAKSAQQKIKSLLIFQFLNCLWLFVGLVIIDMILDDTFKKMGGTIFGAFILIQYFLSKFFILLESGKFLRAIGRPALALHTQLFLLLAPTSDFFIGSRLARESLKVQKNEDASEVLFRSSGF